MSGYKLFTLVPYNRRQKGSGIAAAGPPDPNAEALKRVMGEMETVRNDPALCPVQRQGLPSELQPRFDSLNSHLNPKVPIAEPNAPAAPKPPAPEPQPAPVPAPAPPAPVPPAIALDPPKAELVTPKAEPPKPEPPAEIPMVKDEFPKSMIDRFRHVEDSVAKSVPDSLATAAKMFVKKISGKQDIFKVGPNGEVVIRKKEIKGSDMIGDISSLFTGNPPENDTGMKEFRKVLRESEIPVPTLKREPRKRGRPSKKGKKQ